MIVFTARPQRDDSLIPGLLVLPTRISTIDSPRSSPDAWVGLHSGPSSHRLESCSWRWTTCSHPRLGLHLNLPLFWPCHTAISELIPPFLRRTGM